MYKLGSEIKTVELADLHPTQVTLGFRQVVEKRKTWVDLPAKKRRAEMENELFPVVKGPGGKLYVLDHHHAARALLEEKAHDVRIGLVEDLSKLKGDDFWIYLDHRNWVHCYDGQGRRVGFEQIPKRFEDMKDDPYRSIASDVEDAGGFAKPDEPFYEFLWANHFRRHVPAGLLEKDYDDAVSAAMDIAKSKKSRYLPGWAGSR